MRYIALLATLLYAITANALNIEIISDIAANNNSKQAQESSVEHELYFFYLPSCSYCHKYFPTVLDVATKLNMQLTNISSSVERLTGMSSSYVDAELIARWQISSYPTLVLVNRATNKAHVVVVGNASSRDTYQAINAIRGEFT